MKKYFRFSANIEKDEGRNRVFAKHSQDTQARANCRGYKVCPAKHGPVYR